MNNCPRCKSEATKQNRLVTDSCGHTKCRLCLLEDVSDCLECKIASSTTALPQPEEQQPNVTSNTTNSHITITSQGYHCNICNKSFRSRTQQYYHQSCGNEMLKKYNCTQCSRRFATHSHLKYHINSHGIRSSFTCNICGKSFKQQFVMQRHLRAHKYEPQACPHCHKVFRSQSTLKAHAAMHNGHELPYKCGICAKHYLTKANLKQHQLKHDQNSPRHSCNICQKSFLRQSTLNFHLKRHNKRQLHSCIHCSKLFSDADAMARHIKQHTATEKYRCIQCDITVNRRDNMLRHMRAIHPGEKFEAGVEIIQTTSNANAEPPAEMPPQTVRYNSVIRSVGNVEPVVVSLPQPEIEQPTSIASMPMPMLPADMQKENVKLYRKIILDLDNEEYSNEPMPTELTNVDSGQVIVVAAPTFQQQQRAPGHGSSNFSEMHWRKNFKYSYENEHTN